jgi:thioredoxin reductase (NADPH)
MQRFQKHAERFETEVINDHIHTARLERRPFVLEGDAAHYSSDALVIATGASAKYLGLPSEQKFMGRGVSACATCDGFFYKGQDVLVVGGGNTAVEDALYLSQMASRVTLIHRRDQLRAEKVLQDRLFRNAKIEIVWDSVVDAILGREQPLAVTGVRLKNVRTGALSEVALEGVFIAIGHDPATGLVKGQLEMDRDGYVITAPDSTRTSVPGVFAAGDVQDKIYRQAVTAAASGCMAALEAEKFLAGLEADAPAMASYGAGA